MRPVFVAVAAVIGLSASYNTAEAYKLGGPGGSCPKDPRAQCQVFCDNGQLADYMKGTGSGWSDLVGTMKDPDMNGEAKRIVAKSNSDAKLTGGQATCK